MLGDDPEQDQRRHRLIESKRRIYKRFDTITKLLGFDRIARDQAKTDAIELWCDENAERALEELRGKKKESKRDKSKRTTILDS